MLMCHSIASKCGEMRLHLQGFHLLVDALELRACLRHVLMDLPCALAFILPLLLHLNQKMDSYDSATI